MYAVDSSASARPHPRQVAIGSAVTARSWTEYLRTLCTSFGFHYTHWIDDLPVSTSDSFNPLAAIVVMTCTVVVLLGVKESMRVNLAITAVRGRRATSPLTVLSGERVHALLLYHRGRHCGRP